MRARIGPRIWRVFPLLVGLIALVVPTVGLIAGNDSCDQDADECAWSDASLPFLLSGAMEINVDRPAYGQVITDDEMLVVGGWAADAMGDGTGVDNVLVFADGLPGDGGAMLGAASYGTDRADVASATGISDWANSGFDFAMPGSAFDPGPHTLYVFAHSTEADQWSYTTVDINVAARGSAVYPVAPAIRSNENLVLRLLLQGCGPGYVSNGVQCVYVGNSGANCTVGTCIYEGTNPVGCPAGLVFNGAQCVYVAVPATSCPAGFLYQNGACAPTGNLNCGSGYAYNGAVCVYVGNPSACPARLVYQNGSCVALTAANCGASYYFDGTQCVLAGSVTATCTAPYISCAPTSAGAGNCSVGSYFDGARCTYVGPAHNCPAGSTYALGACSYPGDATGFCSAGYVGYAGRCVYVGTPSSQTIVCPSGSSNGSCATISCPAGQTFQSNGCAYPGYVPAYNTPAYTPACSPGTAYVGGRCVTVGGTSVSCTSGWVYQDGSCRYPGSGATRCGPYINPYANRC